MSSDAAQCNICWPGWGANASPAAGEGLCKKCPSGKFSPGGTDDECSSCGAGETSPPGASDSSDCFDEFTSPSPYDYITTPSSAWVATSTATSAADCETACKGSSTCQYYIFRQDQDDAADNGCFFKVASSSPATDTYVTFKLWTNDYVVWPVSAAVASVHAPLLETHSTALCRNSGHASTCCSAGGLAFGTECMSATCNTADGLLACGLYNPPLTPALCWTCLCLVLPCVVLLSVMQAGATEYPTDASNKFSSDEVDSTDPWVCHDACDGHASCLAVFITKDSNDWVCYRIDGDFSTTGLVASAVKADPERINAQPWITP